jgi:hypothetical protein
VRSGRVVLLFINRFTFNFDDSDNDGDDDKIIDSNGTRNCNQKRDPKRKQKILQVVSAISSAEFSNQTDDT